MWQSILQNITWSIYQSWVVFAALYLLWSIVAKLNLIVLTATQQFKFLLTLITLGTFNFLYSVTIVILNPSEVIDQAFFISNVYFEFVTATVGLMYIVLVLAKIVFSVYKLLTPNNALIPYLAQIDFEQYIVELCKFINIKQPKIYLSKTALVPYTTGFFKKVIILPMAIVNNFSVAEFEVIILHEIAHIKRNDHLWNWILQFAKIIMSLNPFAQLLIKQAIHERELACDDWVLHQDIRPKNYAQTLYKLASLNTNYNTQLALAVPKNVLLHRVKRLFDQTLQTPIKIQWQYFPLLILGLCLQLNRPETELNLRFTAIKPQQSQPIYVKVVPKAYKPYSIAKPVVKAIAVSRRDAVLANQNCNVTPVAPEVQLIEVAEKPTTNTFMQSFVNRNYTKVDQSVMHLYDSIVTHNLQVSQQAIQDVTQKLISEVLPLVASNKLSAVNASSAKIPLSVVQNGVTNFYYADATISFKIVSVEGNGDVSIIATIENGATKLAERFVTINLNKKLNTISL